MKTRITILLLLVHSLAFSQSPYLSVVLKMDSTRYLKESFQIEMKMCEPKKHTAAGNWFSPDTSTLVFSKLKAGELSCGQYFDLGKPTPINGEGEMKKKNEFAFGNQVFAWEKIIVFRISSESSASQQSSMFVVMPVRYKSFVTNISLSDVHFKPGKVFFLDDYPHTKNGNDLSVNLSLKDHPPVSTKGFALKHIL